jgi:hypothetical protein
MNYISNSIRTTSTKFKYEKICEYVYEENYNSCKTRRRRRRQNRRTLRRGGGISTTVSNTLNDWITYLNRNADNQSNIKPVNPSEYKKLVGELAGKIQAHGLGVPDWYELYSKVLHDDSIHMDTKIKIFKDLNHDNETGAKLTLDHWNQCYTKNTKHGRTPHDILSFTQSCVLPETVSDN